jgi:phospholipase D1/2
MAASVHSLFQPGRNCYRAARTRRAALLVDGEAYFRAFAHAALRATESIVVVAWDFHSRTRLHLNEAGVPDLLGDFLNFLVRRNGRLRVFILAWDYPLVFGRGREPPAGSDGGWQPHHRISVHYDSSCPLGAAHHQKIVVIDGAVAFCGGMDLTLGRWDATLHTSADPRRTNVGETQPYGPVHDVMLAVDSGAARALQSVASERWRQATGRALRVASADGDPWPASLVATFAHVDVALARTAAANSHEPAVTEVETLHLDLIAAAKRLIYIENQYFTSRVLGDALAARLAEPQGPEVVVVSRLASSGWLEAPTMSALRTVLIQKLRDADAYGRFQAWYPDTPGEPGYELHSKLMIVDDEWLKVGSANFANRSMGLDTECDLVLAARGDAATRAAIACARNALLAEHLGVARTDLQNALSVTGSLGGTIASLATDDGRSLRRFERLDEPSPAVVALANGVADPESPLSMELITGFDPAAAGTPKPLPARRVAPSPLVAGRIRNLLGGTILGILIGTLVATLYTRQLAVGSRAALDVVWLLVVTFGAIAASRWVIRRWRP